MPLLCPRGPPTIGTVGSGVCAKSKSAEMGSWGVTPEGPKTGILRYLANIRMDSPDSHVREMLIECTVG